TLSGSWTGQPALRQRFNQNGMLWANKVVSGSLTARLEGLPQNISSLLIDSNGTPLAQIIPASSVVNSTFQEIQGFGQLPVTSNPDVPPAAYIDYKILLPVDIDIYITSIQLVEGELQLNYGYQQDTIERQVDHTFHYYKD